MFTVSIIHDLYTGFQVHFWLELVLKIGLANIDAATKHKQAKQGSLGTELAPGKRHTCNRLKHILQREREMPALDALYNNKYAGA